MKIKNEEDISESVSRFLKRGKALLSDGKTRIRCNVTLREFKFKNCKFDVVGYSQKERSFYIVESKFGCEPVSIGHAFGQILAYKCILEEKGYEFLEKFVDKLLEKSTTGMSSKDIRSLLERREAQFKFYVALREKACKNYPFLRLIKKDLPFVGIIRVSDEGACRLHIHVERGEEDFKLCESTPVSISFKKKYRNRSMFFQELEERLKDKLPSNFTFFNATSNDRNYKQFWYQTSSIHFEVWFRKQKGDIEVGLHVESTPKMNDELYQLFLNNSKEIERKIGPNVKIERWGSKTLMTRVVERLPWNGSYRNLDEDLMDSIVEHLKKYIEVLKPIIDDFLVRKRR